MEGNTGHKVFQTQFGECGDLRNFTMCRFYKYTCKSTKSLMNLHQIIPLSDVQIKKKTTLYIVTLKVTCMPNVKGFLSINCRKNWH